MTIQASDSDNSISNSIAAVTGVADAQPTMPISGGDLMLRAMIENSNDTIFVKDLSGRYILGNSAFAQLIDQPLSSILGQDDFCLFPPELAQEAQNLDRQIITSGNPYTYEEVVPIQGVMRTFLTTKIPYQNEQGQVVGLIGIARDISDRKALEAELSLQQARFDAFFTTANAGLVIIDEHLRYVNINDALAEINGVAVADHIGKSLQEVLPDLAHILVPMFQNIIKTGEPVLDYDLIGETPKHPGVTRYWQASYYPLFHPDGRTIGVGGVVIEISDRKRAEAALLKTTHDLQQAQRLAHIGNWSFDVNTQAITWTDEIFRIFGLEPESTPPTYEELLQYYHPQDRDRFQLIVGQAIQEAAGYDTEFSIIRTDGSIGHISAKAEVVQDAEGKVVRLFGTIMDITERHQVLEALRTQTEQLESTLRELQRTQAQMVQSEKMSSLGQLVAGVAHEINNPVNFIYGNLTHANEYTQDLLRLLQLYQQHYPRPATEIQEEAEAIDLEFLTDDLPKLLTSMKVGADRIQKIVASLRNFSRMDEAEMKAVNIHEGLDSTLMILQNRLKAKAEHPTIEVIKEYGQLPSVECYAGQLNQVFMNVLSNAIDALEERDKYRSLPEIKACPSQIHISTAAIARNFIQIRIADNGPGMSKQVIQRLFDPFFTTKAIGKGTGLGMSISYQIITEKHGGSLQCLSVEGKGAEFVIEIPTHQ